MIDVAQYKTEIAAIPGDAIILPRTQINELLAELEAGQIAKRALRRIATISGLTGSMVGAPA
jgi:hypothetical protein